MNDDRSFEIETIVLTRDYLEQIHGRMSFVESDDGADDADGDEQPPAQATNGKAGNPEGD